MSSISIEDIDGKKYIRFSNNFLASIIQSYFPDEDLFRNALPAKKLIFILNSLKKNYISYFSDLINWVEKEYEYEINLIRTTNNYGFIGFKNLDQLLPIGQYVLINCDETITGAKITKTKYETRYDNTVDFHINYEAIGSDGCSFIRMKNKHIMRPWAGLRKINELSIIPLLKEAEIYNKLVARGKIFIKYAIGHHFLQHSSRGRVMVDISRYNKDYYYKYFDDDDINKVKVDNVEEEELFMCISELPVFSLVWKEWYLIDVGQLEEISFDDEAFDKLVLDQTKKSLVESLVKFEYNKSRKTDLISGKGVGCTFLLHGPPGVGKTLTAEAISEMLHRPLYSISVGELGTDAKDLEKELREIFDMTRVWNAIILIDEVDIFLERRSVHEVKRNALVCVFLRLLEYHQGIVFLTTNRVNCFDDSFQSRISVSLEYKELDVKARETLWNTFLEFLDYDPDDVNIKKLSERHLNGREIKNVIKLAKALNKEKNELITTELLEKILNISNKKTIENTAEGNKRKSGINDQDNQPNSKRIR